MNKIGWCMGIEQAGLLADKGFDYIECPLSSLPIEDERALEEQLPRFLDSPLRARAMNLFFPPGIMAVGPEADLDRIRRYVSKAGETASQIGVEIAVLGSGRARTIPEGWDRRRAEAQMLDLLGIVAEEWRGMGVTMAIEPLNRKESNLINSVAEAVLLAKQIESPIVRVLADFYHMDEENEPLETIAEHRDWIAHIHVADTGRLTPGTGSYPYDRFARILKEINYKGMISAECSLLGTDEEMEASLDFMTRKFGRLE
ncbi:sugar phosphate isomerase/epimerase family protein [Cohnella lupini]|uniref:Sugar phosphate isomerase/epimerase n=1 Tax=Cohnella lupini TaxID=1294267 RepID=A0A3D9IPS0_9BACL|nr:sugar phosphate isomerase/epimerase family protein [Cohnella lupini]RED63762.1 sugar phosphate isomerase/epimerase [Cohnella lupini]